jgi:hypothetical protein
VKISDVYQSMAMPPDTGIIQLDNYLAERGCISLGGAGLMTPEGRSIIPDVLDRVMEISPEDLPRYAGSFSTRTLRQALLKKTRYHLSLQDAETIQEFILRPRLELGV